MRMDGSTDSSGKTSNLILIECYELSSEESPQNVKVDLGVRVWLLEVPGEVPQFPTDLSTRNIIKPKEVFG